MYCIGAYIIEKKLILNYAQADVQLCTAVDRVDSLGWVSLQKLILLVFSVYTPLYYFNCRHISRSKVKKVAVGFIYAPQRSL